MFRATLALLLLLSVAVIFAENEVEREERSADSDLVAAADSSADLQLRDERELRFERQVPDLSSLQRESRGLKSWVKAKKEKFKKYRAKLRAKKLKKKKEKERKRKQKEDGRRR